jgi:RNA polymerase sigma factor (sigma-70 family)
VEASALPTRLTRNRAPLSAAFLRVRSDEQLVALFRAGSDDAFRAIHDRYRARLLAYARQMLNGAGSDAEDALQDVFMRAYRALRASNRPVMLRAWLYRIAHNRCIDELRRPCPLPSELAADAEPAFSAPGASGEPPAVAERSAALARLVADVQTLPGQQRSALLMRELQGLSYEELGSALGVSVPAVKSLLLRARTGLIDIAVARDTPCVEIRDELIGAADRSVRISGRARRHCGECASCDAYRGELKRVRRGFAALTPTGPIGQLGMLFGIGGGGGAAAAGGGGAAAAGGGGAAAAGGGVLAGATAAKIAVAVCCAALITTAGRAVIAPSSPAPQTQPPAHSASVAALAPQPGNAGSATTPAAPATPGASSKPTPTGPQQPAGGGGLSGGSGSGGATMPGATTGVSGASGPTGVSGATGPTAATGATGAGATSPDGATGTTGASGATGATATSAVNGVGGASASATVPATDADPATSPAGATGATSTTGATGATGATGTASTASGHYDSTKSGPATGGATATGIGGPSSTPGT